MKLLAIAGDKHKGKFIIVDNEDFKFLSRHSWHLNHDGYPQVTFGSGSVALHRLLMVPPTGQVVDHKNGNKLDNRKNNLRCCSHWHNSQNKKAKKKGFSGFKGVTKAPHSERWTARVTCGGKPFYLGTFDSKIEAAEAYNKKAKELFGAFANLNVIC